MRRRGYTIVGWLTAKVGYPYAKRKLRSRRARPSRHG